jgi:GLPGLI family protein
MLSATAQQTQGKVIFERTVQMQIRIATNDGGNDEAIQNMLPKTRKDKFELSFANNTTLWKQMEDDAQDEMAGGQAGGGMQIRMIGAGSDDIQYSQLESSRKVEQRELGTKKYIIEDSIKPMSWKLSEETKTILSHVCRKATSQKIGIRTMMNMDNGKMERKEIADTSIIVAWFASDIPVSSGPAEYQAQLPGMILELDVNNGKTIYQAIEISPKVDIASIKEPKGSKKITQAEFNKERDKMFEEMGRNGGGGGRTIRISN